MPSVAPAKVVTASTPGAVIDTPAGKGHPATYIVSPTKLAQYYAGKGTYTSSLAALSPAVQAAIANRTLVPIQTTTSVWIPPGGMRGDSGQYVKVPTGVITGLRSLPNPDGSYTNYDTSGTFVSTFVPESRGGSFLGDLVSGVLGGAVNTVSTSLADLDSSLKLSENAPIIAAIGIGVLTAGAGTALGSSMMNAGLLTSAEAASAAAALVPGATAASIAAAGTAATAAATAVGTAVVSAGVQVAQGKPLDQALGSAATSLLTSQVISPAIASEVKSVISSPLVASTVTNMGTSLASGVLTGKTEDQILTSVLQAGAGTVVNSVANDIVKNTAGLNDPSIPPEAKQIALAGIVGAIATGDGTKSMVNAAISVGTKTLLDNFPTVLKPTVVATLQDTHDTATADNPQVASDAYANFVGQLSGPATGPAAGPEVLGAAPFDDVGPAFQGPDQSAAETARLQVAADKADADTLAEQVRQQDARAATEKAAADKAAADKVAADQQAATEKAAADKVLADQQAATEKAATEKAVADKAAADQQAATEKAAADQAAADRATADQAAATQKDQLAGLSTGAQQDFNDLIGKGMSPDAALAEAMAWHAPVTSMTGGDKTAAVDTGTATDVGTGTPYRVDVSAPYQGTIPSELAALIPSGYTIAPYGNDPNAVLHYFENGSAAWIIPDTSTLAPGAGTGGGGAHLNGGDTTETPLPVETPSPLPTTDGGAAVLDPETGNYKLPGVTIRPPQITLPDGGVAGYDPATDEYTLAPVEIRAKKEEPPLVPLVDMGETASTPIPEVIAPTPSPLPTTTPKTPVVTSPTVTTPAATTSAATGALPTTSYTDQAAIPGKLLKVGQMGTDMTDHKLKQLYESLTGAPDTPYEYVTDVNPETLNIAQLMTQGYQQPQQTMYAHGGLVHLAEGGQPDNSEVMSALKQLGAIGFDSKVMSPKLLQQGQMGGSYNPKVLPQLAALLQSRGMKLAEGGQPDDHTHPNYDGTPVFRTGGLEGAGGKYVEGKGDGQSDDIPAMLADGEYVFDAQTVADFGNGSNKAGAKMLDAMREAIRAHKRNSPLDSIPPKSKTPEQYLMDARKYLKGVK